MKEKIKPSDIMVIGFALFAMFFGAGNLIFPPYLGLISGTHWWIAFLGFLIADAGLALVSILVLSKFDGNLGDFFGRVGKTFAVLLSMAIVLSIGPLLAIPRTAATSYELGILPIFGESFHRYLFSIIYFILVFLLTVRPSKVVDIVGKILTPTLLICIAILIIMGITRKIGQVSPEMMIAHPLERGIKDGYQTMDAIAGCLFALVVISAVKTLGYQNRKTEIRATAIAGIIAATALGLVYGGLTYLGATISGQGLFDITVNQTFLIVEITNQILGDFGVIVLAIIAGLACLTTAIGLTSSTGAYFEELTKGKIKYVTVVCIMSILSALISMLGVSKIIGISAPILETVYPCTITLVILGMFHEKIEDNLIYQIPTYVALIFGFLYVLHNKAILGSFGSYLEHLPLAEFGLGWIVPTLIALVIAIGSVHLIKNENKGKS
ncbi:MAG: branched-chain amino acid transport system II carrier protein [Tissierellia bacterium]|nr:branched-chain amino acid transport system II carrier protein [Tissierellia bacterium]